MMRTEILLYYLFFISLFCFGNKNKLYTIYSGMCRNVENAKSMNLFKQKISNNETRGI